MSTKYQPQIDTALRLIRAKGVALLLRKTRVVYDPVSQEVTSSTSADYPMYGVLLPVGNVGKESSHRSDTSTRTLEHIKFLLETGYLATSPGSTPPSAGDTLICNGDSWSVLTCESLAPDGAPIIFTVVATK